MNILELKEFNKDIVVYYYQPEGKGERGEVAFYFAENKAEILKRAGDPSDYYVRHALSKVKECANDVELPRKFTQAWI